ncbi:deoxyribodipyrimidine photo-lyase [Geosmithia morbida]|uniref:Cryptochrome DASH n=1 Tax=Geosmithia morbida TaxID=1094350 RepID=A0A9P4YX89_9HYPO|nr:deoxyribodipyrimidine photo-lyase [Geosmithia morbida]KAF4124530.1 deoxyribodipyrimidine photo-lyase [Geosmithia morbida]
MDGDKVLIYLLRRDLRTSDNPILHHLETSSPSSSSPSSPAAADDERHHRGFTHLLPVYVFLPNQIEVSGLVRPGKQSPYPPAVSAIAKFWRCGPHRARFLAQSVWDLKDNLEELGSGLAIRTGDFGTVVKSILGALGGATAEVWMTEELSHEEKLDQDAVASACQAAGITFKLWPDEKYFVDDRDTGLQTPSELPDVYTSYRKSQEPLRKRPRSALPRPEKSSLPPFPDSLSADSESPFVEPRSLEDLRARLLTPLRNPPPNTPPIPETEPEEDGGDAAPDRILQGGETRALNRLEYLINSGAIKTYKDTRNGLLGPTFSTKLSAFLAFGCISARQIHHHLVGYEDGTDARYESADGYGQGENEGSEAVRLELLWRDYMRLCTAKFGRRLFRRSGFRHKGAASLDKEWKTADASTAQIGQVPNPDEVGKIVARILAGTTGIGLIDASQRELLHTGYTSNRARQNVASFLAKHLGIDWRYGAEWYEMMLVDYDVSSNWSNWQYVAGVGNDPRGDARIFNPIKQAFDYDKDGTYVRTWVPEVKGLDKLENVFQLCTASAADLERCGLTDSVMATDPVFRIEFTVDRKPKTSNKMSTRRRGGRGGGGGGSLNSNGGNGRGATTGHGRTELAAAYGRPGGVVADGNRRSMPPLEQPSVYRPTIQATSGPPPPIHPAAAIPPGAAFAMPAFSPGPASPYHAPQQYGHHPPWYGHHAAYQPNPTPNPGWGVYGDYRAARTGGPVLPGGEMVNVAVNHGGMHRGPLPGYPLSPPPYYYSHHNMGSGI